MHYNIHIYNIHMHYSTEKYQLNKNHSNLAYLIICVTPGVIKTANSYFVPTRRKECAKTKAPKE